MLLLVLTLPLPATRQTLCQEDLKSKVRSLCLYTGQPLLAGNNKPDWDSMSHALQVRTMLVLLPVLLLVLSLMLLLMLLPLLVLTFLSCSATRTATTSRRTSPTTRRTSRAARRSAATPRR